MTMKHRMLLGALLAGGLLHGSLVAQTATPAAPLPADPPAPPLIPASEPAPVPPPSATRAGDKKSPAKSSAKKPAAKPAGKTPPPATSAETKPAATLKAGWAVARERNVNVRGQAAINTEIVTHLKSGDVVTVLDEVTLKNHGADEPDKWAKILLPAGSIVWTHGYFIDATTKAVKPNRLNLRSGPGENYSVLGRIEKGTVVHELDRKGEWIKIEAPTNAYGYVAAHLLSQEPALLAAALAKSDPAARTAVIKEQPVETVALQPTPTIVTAPPPAPPPPAPTATPTQPPPTVPENNPPAPAPAVPTVASTPPSAAPEPPPPSVTTPPIPLGDAEPLIKRIVTREGIVRGSASIQAPTYFVLRSLDNNKTINYLHTVDTNIVIRSFQYQRVIVVGEEVLDERWPHTPVIDVESIQTVP